MPWRAPRACETCGAVRCDCRRKARASALAARPKTAERGYGSKWRTARAAFLLDNPRCRSCGGTAEVVDHIRPHRGDPRLMWSRSNWQPLCAACHNSKSGREAHT